MADSGTYCQNCGYELEDGSKICKRCNLVAAFNLENFLLSKYKLFAIIGIFGARSVYLSTTAATHGNNQFLQYGSYISLSIVILLSFICGWDLIRYSFKILQFPFDGNEHYYVWFKLGLRFSTILLFMSFFVAVIGFISMYILSSDTTIATSLILTIIVDFFIMFIVATFYFPVRSQIETGSTLFRFFIDSILILLLFFMIKVYGTGHTNDIFALLLPIFLIVIDYVLLIRCSWLILQTMDTGVRSLTRENLKKKLRSLWNH